MKKSLSLSIVGILATSLCAAPMDIGIKAPKDTKQETKVFKNINKSEGLTRFDSKLYAEQLPIVENGMECDSTNAKTFVINELFKQMYPKPSFIAAYKALKKSEGSTYCSVSYKDGNYIGKKNYWIVKKNGIAQATNYGATPFACNGNEVIEYFRAIAKSRNIIIEDLGGFESNGLWADRSECTVAYKTSDLSDLEVLKYELSRDEDFNVVLKTSTH